MSSYWEYREQLRQESKARRQAKTMGRRAPKPAPLITDRSPGLVYFIQAGESGPVKIGFSSSSSAESRRLDIQTAHYETLRVIGSRPGTFETESALHQQFEADRIRGEWFRPTAALLAEARR